MIECKNLTMSYEGVSAFNNVSFSLEEGDYMLILGENGSGKSTLVKGLLGLKSPSSGQISFNEITPRQIGYLPQQNAIQKDFPATVKEVVLSGCLGANKFSPFYSKEQKKSALKCIHHLHLEDIERKSFRDLSGGQQQRVLIARALCATDKLLLLDEPVTGLDAVVTAEMYDLIGHLNKVHHVTIIMISHDISNSLKHANKILHISSKSAFFGTTEEYMKTDYYKKMINGGDSLGYSC
ncbi:MAG: metal ABC transporter ATP-binding protein [Firmicutes bacterium]|nr:metal ABC transporter ATP-binding protein [Bacillota bacterium]